MAEYTREIRIGGVNFTTSINDCDFSWDWRGGCDKATLRIASAAFDETFGIEQEDDVDIRFGTGTANRWWRGIVDEIKTSIEGGLTLQCTGTKTLLTQSIPSGRFGTAVETTIPTGITLTEGDADTGAPGAPQTEHRVIITAVDAEGETFSGTRDAGQGGGLIGNVIYATITPSAANKKITVSWVASTNGATGYNVYVNPASDGIGDLTEAGGLVVFDAVGTSKVLDGSQTGEGIDFPFTVVADETSITPTIAGTEIEDIVDYLLDTFLPDELSNGTIDIGALNTDVDYFDLQDNSADMQKVLDSLVAIAGDVQWYVDEDNDVNFVDKSTSIAASRKFVIKTVGTVAAQETNNLVGAAKQQTRDGIAHVKIVGTETFEQGKDASDTELGVTWDSTTEPDTPEASYVRATTDPRIISVGQKAGATMPADADFAWVASFGTLGVWLNSFPNLRWVWLQASALDNAGKLETVLANIRVMAKLDGNASGGGLMRGRPRIATRQFAGVRTSLTSGLAATNWLTRKAANPLKWTMIIDNIDSTMLIVPGQGNVQLTTQQGTRYKIPVQTAKFEFDEKPRVVLSGGDEEYTPREEFDDMRDTALSSSFRRNSPTKWGEFSE